MKKVLLIITVLIAVVIIAAIAFIKFYITPERVKAFVIPAAESALNRKVDIGEIDINIFQGIGLKDLVIKEADDKRDFVKCDEFVLKFKLLPLLSKQVIIDEIRLISPEVSVWRDKEGKFNFEDIGKKEKTEVESVKATEDEQGESAGALPISLLVDSIVISNAKFSLMDLKKEFPDLKTTTDIDISIKSSGASEISTHGNITLRLDEIVMRGSEEGLIRDLKADLEYAARINLETFDIEIEKADLEFQEIPVSLSGSIKSLKESPVLDIYFVLPSLDIAKTKEVASSFVDTGDIDLSGNVSADMNVKGELARIESMKINGNIALEKVGVLYGKIAMLLEGDVKFNDELIDLKIDATIGRNKAQLKGSIRNYFKDQDIKMDLYAKKLYLDEVIMDGEAEPAAGLQKGEDVKGEALKEAEPLDLKMKVAGTVRIDSAVYKGLNMSNFVMKYSFKNNKLSIPGLTANAGKGKLDLKSLVDLSKPGYEYDLTTSLDSLHSEEVVNALFPTAKDTVFGLLSFDLKLKGAGTLPESIKKNLAATGNFNIKGGKLTNSEITRNLAQFMGILELQTINLRKANGKIDIKESIVNLDSVFASDDIAMDPKGKIGLDETLDLAFDLKLSSRLTDKAMKNSNVAKFLKNDKGWGVIPLKISGTFAEPSYAIDVEKAGKQVIKNQTDKLKEKLLDKIFNKNGDGSGKKPEDVVKDLLKGFFN